MLDAIRQGADRYGEADFQKPIPISAPAEVGNVAESVNRMTLRFQDHIRDVVERRNEFEAVLSCMVEGVLAVNADGKIINVNQAAAFLLGAGLEELRDQDIRQGIRSAELLGFMTRVLTSKEGMDGEFDLRSAGNRKIQANGTLLKDLHRNDIGALFVLNDVTRITRLESLRKDFVANVSHELKTPITSIKGFVETLLEEGFENPDDAVRFLEIVLRQTDRMNAIVDDLLALSRLEKDVATRLEESRLTGAIESAVADCEVKAREKEIEIRYDCDPDLTAQINPALFEQALVNLIDNAIKYSAPNSSINIDAKKDAHGIVVSVKDSGVGITQEHIPRLFERFYRVDSARSRKLGGTGLGLAIVKHIVQEHGGAVQVDSAVGEGSTFSIHLPN